MTNKEIAHRLVELCRQEKFLQAIDELYADDATGHEDHGGGTAMTGKAAIRQGSEHWLSAFDLKDHAVEDPAFFGDRFIVRFSGEMIAKDNSGGHPYVEYGLYTIKDGKIAKQEFFYDMPG